VLERLLKAATDAATVAVSPLAAPRCSSSEKVMAAIQRNRISSSIGGAFVVAVSAALLVGGTGGYVMRAMTSHGAASQTVVTLQAPDNQDITQSDLTRAQAPAAAVPDWVQKYTELAPASQLKVDELIENLSYAGSAGGGQAAAGPLEFTR
jgi:hypothetical protein